MSKYKCERCEKEFPQKSNLTYHLNRKIKCKELPHKSTNPPQNSTIIIKSELICNYCGKDFSRSDSLSRHIDGYCKVKKANDKKMEEMMTMLIEMKERLGKNDMEIEKLKEENSKYKQIINNNTQNIKIETMNVNITPYGKEDIQYLTDTDYSRIFSRANMSVPAFVEKIHFDKNKPENHNVYISNMRADYGLLYDGSQWTIHNKEDLLENMYEDKTVILLDQFEQRYDTLDEQTKKMFERFVKRYESDDDKLKMIVKKELQQILYNKRKIAMDAKKIEK